MPWKVSGVVEKRRQFVAEWLTERWTMTELCARHGISRQAGYNTVIRYQQAGWDALEERSRAPRRHPNQTAAEIERQVVELRQEHMRWGPRKLKVVLERQQPGQSWPAASTIGELLRREGLVIPRRKRRRVDPYTAPFATADAPNRIWCGDFKGWSRTQNGERIDPLTITDACSRYLLRCQAVEKTDTARVQAIFEAAFREYGLPDAIRTDNGAPFASRAIAGLSRLAVWWMKLGIVPERIQPAHPEQNGRHERMHLTLQQETMSMMAATRRAQQRRFDQFRREYNEQRPHEALHMRTPASCYAPSPRTFPARVHEPEYGSAMLVRRVHLRGQFSWKHEEVFLSETLIGERIGLEAIDDRCYRIFFSDFALAEFDSQTRTVHRLRRDWASTELGAG
ncbi:MAG TPA: IS481 family transposase, partial [Candidatus Sulfotelmatobacter sp.]|nr:IS481 family transposase [Candidatus Sulfotelmatobacter sp.]